MEKDSGKGIAHKDLKVMQKRLGQSKRKSNKSEKAGVPVLV